MKIYRPLKTNQLNQRFGENKACVSISGKIITKTGLTCPVGYKDFYTSIGMKGHNGEDWDCWRGEPIYFPVDFGEFWIKTEIDRDGGIGANAISKEQFEGTHLKFKFWHEKGLAVYDNQTVKLGSLIGWGGSTGKSSGPHLHWSMKRCDKDGNVIDKNNGYTGAIDFRPYFENIFILDILDIREKTLTIVQQTEKLIYQVRQFISRLLINRKL